MAETQHTLGAKASFSIDPQDWTKSAKTDNKGMAEYTLSARTFNDEAAYERWYKKRLEDEVHETVYGLRSKAEVLAEEGRNHTMRQMDLPKSQDADAKEEARLAVECRKKATLFDYEADRCIKEWSQEKAQGKFGYHESACENSLRYEPGQAYLLLLMLKRVHPTATIEEATKLIRDHYAIVDEKIREVNDTGKNSRSTTSSAGEQKAEKDSSST